LERVYNHADSRQIQTVLNQAVAAVSDCTGSFTLANSATTTTVTNPKITSQSKIIIQPRSANSAAASAFVNTISNGSFVVGHSSAVSVRSFDYWFSIA
jgi:hypothetical protein